MTVNPSAPPEPPAPGPVPLVSSLEGPAGAPVVVLGNSLGTTRAVWEPQQALLRRHFRLLVYEHRGHGGSPAPAGPYTIGQLGADVLALLDGYGIERAAYCGISLGGMIGLWLASNAPDRIAAMNSRSCNSMPLVETSTADTSIGSSRPVTRSSYRAIYVPLSQI